MWHMLKTRCVPARSGSRLRCASPTQYCSSLSPKPAFWVSLLLLHLGVGQKSVPSENRMNEWINKQINGINLLKEIIRTWSSKAPKDPYYTFCVRVCVTFHSCSSVLYDVLILLSRRPKFLSVIVYLNQIRIQQDKDQLITWHVSMLFIGCLIAVLWNIKHMIYRLCYQLYL